MEGIKTFIFYLLLIIAIILIIFSIVNMCTDEEGEHIKKHDED